MPFLEETVELDACLLQREWSPPVYVPNAKALLCTRSACLDKGESFCGICSTSVRRALYRCTVTALFD